MLAQTVKYTTTVISLQKLLSLRQTRGCYCTGTCPYPMSTILHPVQVRRTRFIFTGPTNNTSIFPPPPPPSLCNPEQYLSLSSRLVTASHTPTITKQKVRDLCIVCPGPRAGFRYILTAKVTIQERAPQARISWARGIPGPIPRRALREVQFQAAYNTRVTDGLSTSSLTW